MEKSVQLEKSQTVGCEALSVAQLANMLGMSRQHIYRLAQRNELPFPVKRIGSKVLFSRQAVLGWLEHFDEKVGADSQ